MTEFISRKYGNEGYEVIIKTDNHEHYKASENFARQLIDHAKPVTDIDDGCKWIPVSERLPEDDLPKDSKRKSIKVLVTYKTSNGVPVVRTQVREKEPWFNSMGWDWTKSEPITHWMPLPEPPKEENK